MDNRIVFAETYHKRTQKKAHAFSYTLPYFLFKLDDLPSLNQNLRLFSYNKKNVYSVFDEDYLHEGDAPIQTKAASYLPSEPGCSVWLITFPRIFARVFNPVSFYFLADSKGNIRRVLAEVTNTYHEKHVYLIESHSENGPLTQVRKKEFHVSPFLKEGGQYHFKIGPSLRDIAIHITYKENDETQFYANLIQKKTVPFTDNSMLKSIITFPFSILSTLPRIYKEAAKLYFLKRITARNKPVPTSTDTIRSKPGRKIDFISLKLVKKLMNKFEIGTLRVTLPDQSILIFGNGTEIEADMRVYEFEFFTRLVKSGEIGLGESYVEGWWDTSDLTQLLTYFLRNKHQLKHRTKGSFLSKISHLFAHRSRKNSISNSKKNIQDHYDLSNDFYRLFLDKTMNYSSGLYLNKGDSLEKAQEQKLDRLIRQMNVKNHHHVLEIGSGWGAMAVRLAETTGCRVTTLTLSQAQFDWVNDLIQKKGLSDQIEIKLEDYRHHRGTYDRLVSIEMIEAVGHEYLPAYFSTIDSLLKPEGIAAIQAITIPEQRYDSYLKRQDWIQKHIFPGGHLPSLEAIQHAVANHTSFIIEDIKNIGPSYAETLREWRLRFIQHEADVISLGFDELFIRKWLYYLCYCEAGFENRYVNDLQIVLTRPVNTDLIKEDKG